MTDKNQEKQMTDVELSLKLSYAIYENYHTALEFIETHPDYSLLKFRKVLKSIVEIIADKEEINLENKNLNDSIKYLVECGIPSKLLDNNLHDVKFFCNDGIHNGSSFKNKEESDEEINRLRENALIARKKLIEIFEYVYFIMINKQSAPTIISAIVERNNEIIYNSLTSTNYKEKLKAGIIYEDIFNTQLHSASKPLSRKIKYSLSVLIEYTLAFYESAYKLSAQVDDEAFADDTEKVILQKCELEPLYKYASFGLSFISNNEKFKKLLQIVADRGYIPAKALLGFNLYEENQFKLAFKYLLSVKNTNESIALWQLYYCYTEGKACSPNPNKAFKYLRKAVKLKYPDALATLSKVYHNGEYLPKDDEKSQELLEESIALGSKLGKKFKEHLQEISTAKKPKPITGGEKIGRNEKCPCGSGKKYKKCCGSPNKKIQ
jgi:hypothetical protein